MASPVDASRVTTSIATAATSHTINVGSPAAGTLLMVFVSFTVTPTAVTFTGYTPLFGNLPAGASACYNTAFYRLADGTEGATDAMTTTASVKLSAICWSITGAADPATQAPEYSLTNANGTTTANTANPPSVSVTGGPKDVLYLAMAAGDGETSTYTAFPTNYSNLAASNSGTGGAVSTNNTMGGASRAISASSSDDPGVFTHGAHATGWRAHTIVIHPPAASTVIPVGFAVGRDY